MQSTPTSYAELLVGFLVIVLAFYFTIVAVVVHWRDEGRRALSFLIAAQLYSDHLTILMKQVMLLSSNWDSPQERGIQFALLRAMVERLLASNPELAWPGEAASSGGPPEQSCADVASDEA